MNNTILVSVIIPVYNVAEYIERCFLSVLNQTYKNLEIILIDDKSPDNSVDIILNLLSKCDHKDRVKLIRHNKNRGLSAARNTGIENSTGTYLYFLDSDDEIMSDTIQILLDLAIDTNADIAMGNVKIVDSNNSKHLLDLNHKYPDKFLLSGNKLIRSDFFVKKWSEVAWNKLIRKEFVLEHNLFFEPNLYHEDVLWSFNISLYLKNIAFTIEDTYVYYLRENSITTNATKKNIEDRIFIYNKIVDCLNNDISLFNDNNCLKFLANIRYLIMLYSAMYDYTFFKECFSKMKSEQLPQIQNISLKMRLKSVLFSMIFPKKITYILLRKKRGLFF